MGLDTWGVQDGACEAAGCTCLGRSLCTCLLCGLPQMESRMAPAMRQGTPAGAGPQNFNAKVTGLA